MFEGKYFHKLVVEFVTGVLFIMYCWEGWDREREELGETIYLPKTKPLKVKSTLSTKSWGESLL